MIKPSILILLLFTIMAAGLPVYAGDPQAPSPNIGKVITESDFRFKYVANKPEAELAGKPLLIEFWATWCPPCRDSIPHLNKLHETTKDKGLIIIGISDEDKRIIKDFIETTPMNYVVASDEKARLKSSLGVKAIPRAFLINKEGKIVWEGHPMSIKESHLAQILD